MPILSNIIRGRTRTTGPNPALAGYMDSGFSSWPSRTLSGAEISDDKALGLTAVLRSITLISTTAGGLPINVYQRDRGDGASQNIETPQTAYLWDRPNPEMTRQTYWETVIGHEVMGDAFLFVVKNRFDDPLQLWYIEPWRVRTGRTEDGVKVYEVDNKWALIDFASGGEIIHVPNWGRSPLRGINPLKAASGALGLGISSQEYAERFFDEDEIPRGLITTDQVISEEESGRLWARWRAQVRRGTPFLGNGAKFQTINITPEEAQLIDERRFQLAEVARIFGIPPHMLGDTERSTSWGTGIEEQTRGFLTFTLQAHINRFEHAINDALLKKFTTRRYVKFELGGLLRPDSLKQAQIFHILIQARVMVPNEARKLLDLPAKEGGDEFLAQGGMMPVSALLEQEPAPGAAPSANGSAARNGAAP